MPDTTTIVPRWEWRTFDGDLTAAHEFLANYRADRVQDSDEIYLLARHADASVKLRDDVLDAKRLQQVNDAGLELWRPVMKSEFPIDADGVRSVLELVNADVPALERTHYARGEFRHEIVERDADLTLVRVSKHREHYVIDGCMVESTVLRVEDRSTRSIAVESPEPERVVETVRLLGLAGRSNVNVARGLKTLIGFGATRHAVIDIGTNSVKFHLAEVRADGSTRTLADRSEVTRLGEGLDAAGRLQDAAIDRTLDAFVEMVDEARREAVQSITAVGTAALRIAPNGADFANAAQSRTDVVVEIISGEEEARLAFLATSASLPLGDGRIAVFDSGGGSSQFTYGERGRIEEQFSVNVGAARFTDQFGLDGAVDRSTLDAALEAIAADLDALDRRARPDAVVGMGGTSTNLAAVKHGLAEYDADVVHGTVLGLAELDRQIELYRTRDADARRSIVGLQPKRAEVVLAGACIVRTIVTKLGHHSFTVSDRGLRHGVFAERFTVRG